MTARIMIDIIALLAASPCGLIASLKTLQMVDKVNEKLPRNEQFDPLWWLGLFAAAMPVMHMKGAHYGEIAKSPGGFFFV
jgi:hypothetical protein